MSILFAKLQKLLMDPGELRAIQYQNQRDFVQRQKVNNKSLQSSSRPMTAAEKQRARRQNQQFKKDFPCLSGCIEITLTCIFNSCQWMFCFPSKINAYCKEKHYQSLKAARQATLNEILQILKKPNVPPKEQAYLYDARDKIMRQIEDMRFIGRKQDLTDYGKVPQIRKILEEHRRLDSINLSKQTQLPVRK